MTKKILSVFLAALMVFSMVPFAGLAAFASDMPVSHTHTFEYTATGATLTATCTEGCDKSYDTTPLTITLTEDGFDETALMAWMDVTGTEPAITYTNAVSEENFGETKPTEPGKYKIQAVVEDKTAVLAFSIADPAIITWAYDEETKTLTLGNDSDAYPFSEIDWSDKEVDKVVVASAIAPVSMASWFKGVNEFIGLDNIITDNVTDMTGLFEGSTVSELDISAWKIYEECVVADMFKDCSALTKLTSPDSAAEIVLPDAPEGKAWEASGSVYTFFALNTPNKVYSIMPVADEKPYFTLTYLSDSKKVEKKVTYNTADKAYSVNLLSKDDAKDFAPNSLYTFSKWKDENGKTYTAKEKITLTGDMTLSPVWKATVLIGENGQYTQQAKSKTDYTLKDGVLTVLKNGVCIGGMLENTVIKTAEGVTELAFMTLTTKNDNGTEPLITVDSATEKFTLTVIDDNTVNMAEGQSLIADDTVAFTINRLPQMGAVGTLNVNADDAPAIHAAFVNIGNKDTENSLTVNIIDKAASSSQSTIVSEGSVELYNCCVNVERNAVADAPAAVKAKILTIGDYDGTADAEMNIAEMNISENGEAVALELENNLTAASASVLTVKSAKNTAVKAGNMSFYADTKIDIRSEEAYALELFGSLQIDGEAENKNVKVTFATGSETVSAITASYVIINAKALPESAEKSFDLYSGIEKLTLSDKELVTDSGDKAAVVKLNVGGFRVGFKCGDDILKTVTVSGGELAAPPAEYKFIGDSEKYYYTPITADTLITVAEAEENVPLIPEKAPDCVYYVKAFTNSVHDGHMNDRNVTTDPNMYEYTYVTNDYFVTKASVNEQNDPDDSEEVTGSHYEYTKKDISELHELSGRYFVVGDDVKLSDLQLKGSEKEILFILARGANVTVKGSDATEEEPAKPAIENPFTDVSRTLMICGTEEDKNYDASLTVIGGDGNEAFPTGASGIRMPQSGSLITQSDGIVSVKAGKSVGGSKENFAMDVNEICIGNGTLTATGTPGETESAGIKAHYLQAGRFATLNAYGAKGKAESRGIVSDNVYLTNNYDMKTENDVSINVEGSGNAYAIESDNIVFEGEVKFNAIGGNGVSTGALSMTPIFDDPLITTNENKRNGYSDFDLAECFAGATPGCKYINGVHSFGAYRNILDPTFPITAKYMSFKTIRHSFMYRTREYKTEGNDLVNNLRIEAHCINCAIAEGESLDDYSFETQKKLSSTGPEYNDRETAEYAASYYSNVYCLNCAGTVEYVISNNNDNADDFDGEEKSVLAFTQMSVNDGYGTPWVVDRDTKENRDKALTAWKGIVGNTCWGRTSPAAGIKLMYSKDGEDTPLSDKKPYYPNKTDDSYYKVYLWFEYRESTASAPKTLKAEGFVNFQIRRADLHLVTPSQTLYMDENGSLKEAVDPIELIKVDGATTPGYDRSLPNSDTYKPTVTNDDITCTITEGTDCVKIEDGVLIPLKTGTAKLSFVINETKCYNAKEVDYTVTVKKRPVDIPSITTAYQYEGGTESAPVSKEQTIDKDSESWEGFYDELMSIEGESVTAKEVSTTPVTLKLKDTVHYCWANDGTEAEETTTVDWTITKVDAPAYFTTTVSGDDINIPNRAGTVKSFAFPEKVPVKPEGDTFAATTFTADECDLSKVTEAIADGKLQLTVGENHIVKADGDTFTANVIVSSNNFNDYTVEYTVKPVYHTHEYESALVENNDKALNVSCKSTTDFKCFCEEQPKMIEIDYPKDAVNDGGKYVIPYTASPILCQYSAADWEAGYEDTATNYIKYYELKDDSYEEMTEGKLPTVVGTYKAELAIGGKSVAVVYDIIKADVEIKTDTKVTATVTYGDEVTNGVISGSMQSAVTKADVPGTFAWNGLATYGDAGTNEFTATFTPTDTHNFNVNNDVTVDVTVNKANATEEMKAASLGSIENRVGSTTIIDLSSKLPTGGATFGSADVPTGIASASISGNELSLEIINNHVAVANDPFTVNVSVTDAKNYNDYTVAVSVDVLFHTHSLAYNTIDNAIVASCDSTTEFDCYLNDNSFLLTLNENPDGKDSTTVVYTGDPVTFSLDETRVALWKTETGEDPTSTKVTYTAKEGSSLKDGKAVDVGSYTASYTFHAQTITRDFMIVKADVEVNTLEDVTVVYGTEVKNDVIIGTMKNVKTGAVSGKFTWNNLETYGDAQDEMKTFTATFTPDDAKNFNANNNIPVKVKVNKTTATAAMKAAESRILNKAGSTAELDLKDKLPAGASFGEVTVVPEGMATASVADSVLKLQVAETDITKATRSFQVNIAVNDATNYEDYTITVTVEVFFHVHVFDTAYSFDSNAHWFRCIGAEECDIKDYSTCGMAEAAYGEHIGMEDYICDVCGYEDIPACKAATIKMVEAALTEKANDKQIEIATKAIEDIKNADTVAAINEISEKAVKDIARNAVRCPLCPRYEEKKDIPFYGFILSIVHMFVHLAYSLGRIS